MTKEELNGIWNYFLTLESDLAESNRYIEPRGQETVYSFEFAKILVLACTEIESVFKYLSRDIDGIEYGDIRQYKKCILEKNPKITEAEVEINRWGKTIRPFEDWSNGKLFWWEAYQEVKHNRGSHFEEANYINAVYALSALYILVFFCSYMNNLDFNDRESKYIVSDYENTSVFFGVTKHFPGFEKEQKHGDQS